ncbi:MAG TPA: hypothetical protein VJ850_05380 [Candidatus Limnocylindrales bacterium]|nr:hypothetical protein [Candidatus Limnocylindrales bacterium]
MFERFASTDLLIAAAVAVFAVSAIFLVVAGIAGARRMRGHDVGNRLGGLIALVGGAALGTMLLFSPDVTVAAPLVLVAALTAASRWRAGRHRQAGWIVAGTALPVAIGWALVLAEPSPFTVESGSTEPILWLAGALIIGGVGLFAALRGDPTPPAPAPDAAVGQPGSRALGSIAAAIREPAMIGPFGLPEIAMLIAFVGTWVLVPLFLPRDAGLLLQIGVPSVLGAILGTEAYIRAMPPRSRKAFEAFSWLGEWELARAKSTIGGLPTNAEDAQHWLEAHPVSSITNLDEQPIRIEIQLLAGRFDDARAELQRLPRMTAWDRFERAALTDLVGWRTGGGGDLPAMEAAAAEILPRDGDERLRAEVSVAVAKVRRLMADGRASAGDAAAPLLEVRPRLGKRANGQVGRALRRRLIPVLLVVSLGFGFISTLLGSLA